VDRHEKAAELKNIIGEYLKIQRIELVDLILRQEGRDLVLRVFADKPEGGITIGECAGLNERISSLLDEKGILEAGGYILEVSSPGLDRPLKERRDFLRCINKKARFFLNELINGKIELEGLINKVENDSVYVEVNGEVIEIPLTKINKAKQLIT
jgi:ribosome maturation factor RimP